MKKVIIAGASGMTGNLVLEHCLSSSEIVEVTSLARTRTNKEHSRLNEVIISDFTDYSRQEDLFHGVDIAFFCIGVYTGQVPGKKFREITVDYAIAFAEAVKRGNPNARLCFLSGAGADRTEKSSASFARYKGMAEILISELGLDFHTFRPGYIYPVTPRKEPNLMYRILRILYPLLRLAGSNSSIKSTELAAAMFQVGLNGAKSEILENRDILEYA
ncbi:NAD(P)H-binding protein [Leptobacterium flavescens]|uniref:NAD(P)H-binding protein n=1 Tax=Leptobacterium flavescens TaxID=472055 RepID=A0A6P0UQK6_9FLAO|nr:NAD(P)H-binding protein [Leptobacterium flavescens]NER15395.1 NAD(P)H-binding protein [Leptobacterium flavescens]